MNMDIRIDIELKKIFKDEFAGTDELTFEESRIPSHLIISCIYLNTCTTLEAIFKKRLETLPVDLTELRNKCKYKAVFPILP